VQEGRHLAGGGGIVTHAAAGQNERVGFPEVECPELHPLAAVSSVREPPVRRAFLSAEKAVPDDARQRERRLTQRMLEGDERAFEEFFSGYAHPLYRFALRRSGGNEDLAEEVVQRTLCSAIDGIATWRGDAQLFTWLCAICRRELADHFRRQRRIPVSVELTEDSPEVRAALESVLTGAEDPERHALRREVIALVHITLDHLPPHYARVLEWKYLEDTSMKEIASRLGSTSKAVESLLTRARTAYREALGAVLRGHPSRAFEGGAHG
jgi:RNA polymerase sigma-70 factor (ECF subfamily)